jgi:hypothetical protein
MARRGLLAMLVVVTPLIVGCTAIGVPQSGPLATYPRPDFGMDALLEGTLTVRDDCVAIARSDGAITVPVFPSGDASWTDGVLSWRDGTFGEGDPISVGGGLAGPHIASSYIPAGCSGLDAFTVSPF